MGRIAKTLHLLAYIDDEAYRRRILRQINRGEGATVLPGLCSSASAASYGGATKRGQEDQLGALGLVVNAIVSLEHALHGCGTEPAAGRWRRNCCRRCPATLAARPQAPELPRSGTTSPFPGTSEAGNCASYGTRTLDLRRSGCSRSAALKRTFPVPLLSQTPSSSAIFCADRVKAGIDRSRKGWKTAWAAHDSRQALVRK